jgi:LysR family transcriptional regulator, carnitine catabolism transcriptional activator
MNPASSNLSLRQLRAFLAIASEQSITKAAEKLHLTPSAISMLIRNLESELGVRLFDRTTRKLELTPAGTGFLPAAESVFGTLADAIENIRQVEAAKQGRFTIATSPLLAADLIPKLMASFREKFPEVHIRLLDLPVGSIANAVQQNDADFGICTAPTGAESDLADLKITTLYKDRLMLACPTAHPFADRREVTWGELLDEPLALLKAGSGIRSLVEQGFESTQLNPSFEVAHVATAVGLVDAGLALAILPSYTLARSPSKNIRIIALTQPIIERDIVTIWKATRELPTTCVAFLEHFKAKLDDL